MATLLGSCLAQQPALRYARARRALLQTRAQDNLGFGSKKGAKAATTPFTPVKKTKQVDINKELGRTTVDDSAPKIDLTDLRWRQITTTADFRPNGTKAVFLGGGKTLVLYKVGDKYYCSDAESTAYRYPLIDAKILSLEAGPAVEVPLDGTVYSLTTGEVITWCPTSGGIVRGLLGALKKDSQPIPLKVYETYAEGRKLYVKLT